jgi:minor curlin subunit
VGIFPAALAALILVAPGVQADTLTIVDQVAAITNPAAASIAQSVASGGAVASGYNTSVITQTGNANTASIEQTQGGNTARTTQTGDNNSSAVQQFGSYGSVTNTQAGSGLGITVTQTGNAPSITITQTRAGH